MVLDKNKIWIEKMDKHFSYFLIITFINLFYKLFNKINITLIILIIKINI